MLKFLKQILYVCLVPCVTHSFEIQGHRGSRGTLPENSLPSFGAAVEAGADGMEMDLLMTQDQEIAIHHNFFINPALCTYLDGSPVQDATLIQDASLAELKEFDLGQTGNPNFPEQALAPGTQIPTLAEVLTYISSMNHPNAQRVRLNLEVKAKPQTPEYIPSKELVAQKIVQIVKDYDFSDRVLYSSFDLEMLHALRKCDPKADLAIIFEEATLTHYGVDLAHWVEFIIKHAKELQVKTLAPDNALLSASKIQLLHNAGLRVIPWTIDEEKRCLELVEMGVDGIITDYPEKMVQLRKQWLSE